jgi:hypothetical protein
MAIRTWIALTVLRAYPQAWRARYGDEMRALLQARSPSARDISDLLRGAAREQALPSVRYPDSIPSFLARLGLAAVVTLPIFLLVDRVLLARDMLTWTTVQRLLLLPSETMATLYLHPQYALDFWLVPFCAALLTSIGLRHVCGDTRARRLAALGAAVVTLAVGFAWVLTSYNGWGVLLSRSLSPTSALRLFGISAVYALHGVLVYCILERRTHRGSGLAARGLAP